MGLFEELIVLVKETIDEVNERQRKKHGGQPSSQPSISPGNQDDELARVRERLARQAAQQQAERARAGAEAVSARPLPQTSAPAQSKPITKSVKPVIQPQGHQHRLARLMHRPGTLRELVVLREILDKPLALRRRR